MKKRNGHIGVISNHKGGTGKTVTSVNLGAALSLEGKKVLVIDNDPQCNASRALMRDDVEMDGSLYHLLEGVEEYSPKDCIYPTRHKNLFILPNITETSGLEYHLYSTFPDSNWTLRRAVYDYVKENFDYAFIDCPPTLSIFVSNAMYAADFIIVPVTAGSGNAMEGVPGVLDLMRTIKNDGNKDLRFLRVLINNIDGRKKSAHQANINLLHTLCGEENVFQQHIPTSSAFEVAETLRNETIFTHARTSQAAAAFRKVAAETIALFEG